MSDPADRRRWLAPLVWGAIVLVATSWPNPDLSDVGDGDKLIHFLSYALLAWLIGRALSARVRTAGGFTAALLGLAAFAALDEWHQAYIPGRSASVGDWYADVGGAVLGLLAALLRRSPTRAAS